MRQRLNKDLTVLILAGGKSSRMKGENKAFLRWGKSTLIEHIIDLVSDVSCDIRIVTNTPEEYQHLNCQIVRDMVPYKGPLVGILSGLESTSNSYCFVTGCDMPFLDMNLVRYMLEGYENYDVVLPKIGGIEEPLCAIYSKNCIIHMENMLKNDNLKIHLLPSFLDDKKVRYISLDEIKNLAVTENVFVSINKKEDYFSYGKKS